MAAPGSRLPQLTELWETCKRHDDQKQSLITDLFRHVNDLNEQLSVANRDLKLQKGSTEYWLSKGEETQRQVQALVHEKERHAYVVVLVDGDCMPFKDELLKEGLQGGCQAAHNLKQSIKQQLDATPEAKLSHPKVMVRVYANLKGLSKVCHDASILSAQGSLEDFVRGFNKADALCDFVDAGNGKECSDVKVKTMFELHIEDVHCQHIFFGGSADNGYARLLGQHVGDKAVCGRITLLEGPPFAYELAEIKDRFRVAVLEDVFRREKLPTIKRRVSFHHVTPPATPSLDYASIAAKPASPGPGESAGRAPASTATALWARASSAAGVIKHNRLRQRVDPPLEYNQFDFMSLKHRRMCNNFHLLGECYFEDKFKNCQHDHGDRLSPEKRQALRAVARLSKCQWGLDCADPKCTAGHRCTRSECVPASCKFPPEMHNVDTRIV